MKFRFQVRNFAQLFKKCYDHYFGCEVGDQDKRCAPQCLCNVSEAFDRMGKWFAPTEVRPTHGLEGNKRPLILFLLPFKKHNKSKQPVKFISVINQLDSQNVCFTISLFHASTCFKHMCSSSGGQNCITQPLVSSHL